MIAPEGTLLVRHCAQRGRLETPIRFYLPSARSEPYRRHSTSVSVLFEKQSGRKIWKVVIVPDNLTYYTIETNGQIAYDSRELIPCDMDRWRTRAAWLQPPAGGVH